MTSRVIASIGAGPHEPLLRLAKRTFVPYARRHGYDLELRTEVADSSRPAPWSKILLLHELVLRYDTVVWLDADTMIVDHSVDIADVIVPGAFLYLVEHTVQDEPRPNTGVMVLRGGHEAAAFLEQVWAMEEYINHRWWENAAVCELLGYSVDPPARLETTALRERTRFVSPRWNWIISTPVRGALIRHFPGYAPHTRRLMMLAALAESRVLAGSHGGGSRGMR